ncbi:hypothetical protein [Parasitella parasitica]|uniref:F-box domain-containing protein n=1 Tax=Parasitella parasitica TaxID=35722 RepID=A0A0B7NPS8_9FUNG|nr:hypothetical protein [Parasitella parasitica]
MNRLPKELYALIFLYLTQEEKLECLLVSRYWYEKIKQLGVLFSPLVIQYDYFKLYRAIEYFDSHHDMAHQISEFVFNDHHPPEDSLFVKLPVLFNNLKVLDYQVGSSSDVGRLSGLGAGSFLSNLKKWSSKLRAIKEVNLCKKPLTSYIISVPCLYLTRISLKYNEPHWNNNLWEAAEKATKNKLITDLKNASSLESLTLDGVHLTMHDFELIHRKLPRLKKLILQNFTFRLNETLDYPYADVQHVLDSNNAIIVDDPAPVSSLEHLEILMFYDNNLEFQDVKVTHQWLKYLGKKYSGLTHFTLGFVTDDLQHTMYEKQPCEELVLPIIQSNPNLKAFAFEFAPISAKMIGIMDANGTQLESVVISAYLQDLESQLSVLADSNQKNTIQKVKITIHDNVEFDPDGEIGSFSGHGSQPTLDTYGKFITGPLKQFPCLTHLDVNGDKQNISIAWLPKFLEEFKHLESVRLHHLFYAESLGSQPFEQSHVKDINLHIFIFPSVLALEPCCEQLCKQLRLCPDLETFSIESFFFGLYPHEEVEVLGGSYYALPEYEDERRSERKVTMKLDFRQCKKLKRINLDFSDKYLYVCVYRNDEKKYTLYQAQRDENGRLAKVRKAVPTTEYYATLYLNDNPVYVNNTLITK